MAELSTLARPYARAAFEFARDTAALTAWGTQLQTAAAVTEHEKVMVMLANPSLTAQQQASKLIALCGDELDDALRNFLTVLADNKRLPLLPEVNDQFAAMKTDHEKSVDVEIVTPYALADDTVARLKQALTERLDRVVRIGTTTDKDLLGGVLIRAGDTVIDGSVRGRLNKLAEAMNS